MKVKLILLMTLVSWFSKAQSGNFMYHTMLDVLLKHSVEEISADSAFQHKKEYFFLDARSIEEYNVSYIKDAVWIGYEDFDLKRISGIDKEAKVIVYCSVGYRSEKITEQLLAAGFSTVYNMYGGVFEWVNNGYPVFNKEGKTDNIHGYNKKWGIWLNEGEVVY